MGLMKMAALAGLALTPAWALGAQECQPSRWGPDDELGNANLITPESVLKAAQLVKTGRTYSLGITVDAATPAFPPRNLSLMVVQPNQQGGAKPLFDRSYNDDLFMGWLGIGSQLDGLGHLGTNDQYYNCNQAADFSAITGLTKLGIEKVPPLVARGIVLDMAAHYGVPHLAGGQVFNVADVQAVEKRQGTPVREGDVVLFHTGWTDAKLDADPDTWVSTIPGAAAAVSDYLAGKNVVAAGADTWGYDAVPPEHPERPYPGHVTLLKDHGIYILETMNTGPLVRDGAYEFLFILGQAKLRGAVQMIINPVAIR